MTRTPYPTISSSSELINFAKEITRLRDIEDVPDFRNLTQRFVGGRTTTRVPSTPADVLVTDNEGDIVTDGANGFEYKLVDVSGTLTWDRRTLNTSW